MSIEPIVDPEFAALLPPLEAAELTALEKSLLEQGCLSALIIWKEENVLLDGHHRLRICKQHGLGYRTHTISLLGRVAALQWIFDWQDGRRNWNTYTRAVAALKCKPQIEAEAAKRVGGRPRGDEEKPPQNSAEVSVPERETRRQVSKLAGVSHDTIRKVEMLEKEAPEETKQALREGKTSIHKEYTKLRPPNSQTLDIKETRGEGVVFEEEAVAVGNLIHGLKDAIHKVTTIMKHVGMDKSSIGKLREALDEFTAFVEGLENEAIS